VKHNTAEDETRILYPALDLCKRRRVAIDGGANVGVFTEKLLAHFEYVLAFEPVPVSRYKMENLFRGNPRVRIDGRALWDKSNQEVFLRNPRKRTTSTSFHVSTESGPVPTISVTIDDEIVSGLDLLKLDLEGAELRALHGAVSVLRKFHPVIIVECVEKQLKRYKDSIKSLEAFMSDLDYRLVQEQGVNRLYA